MGVEVGAGVGVGVHDRSGVDVGVHSGLGVDVGDGVTVGTSVASTTVFHKGIGVLADRYARVSPPSEVQANPTTNANKKRMEAPIEHIDEFVFVILKNRTDTTKLFMRGS